MPIDIEAVGIFPLNDVHVRSGFRCTNRPIQNFCRGELANANRQGIIRAFVACENDCQDVVGFYYLITTSVEHDHVHRAIGDQYAALDKIPALYLGMIGVHQPHMRNGIGTLLMRDAFLRVLEIARNAGVWALTLDAIDDDAATYYEGFDFQRFAPDSLEMYLPVGTILAMGLNEP